ncbi:MAG: FAD synthase [Methanoregulaceae archaeon PtaB.Bin056]|nr:MAG: FAD synthase [Methanoregulaceae archaeon PtaB.Bin056]
MKRVVATGTFDILHPGHLYYLEESRRLGDELYVIVARDRNVRHKPRPVIPEEQRARMVAALKPVDHAVLGDLHDMFRPIEEIRPAVITFGFNQHFEEEKVRKELEKRGLSVELARIGSYRGDRYCSSSEIVRQVLARYPHGQGPRTGGSNDGSSARNGL